MRGLAFGKVVRPIPCRPTPPTRYNGDAMAAAARTVFSHITKDPGIRGGKACVDGTRIAVMDIVELQREGKRPEEMLNIFAASLTLAQVHAALAYYYDNADEIEAALDEDAQGFDELDKEWNAHAARHGGHPPERPSGEDRKVAKPVDWPPKV